MRKVKLFFLLTALLAIAQGAWAYTKTFSSPFVSGYTTQSPIRVYVDYAPSWGVAILQSSWIDIDVISAGYIITEVQFSTFVAYNPSIFTVNHGTIINNGPTDVVTVSNVNNTQFHLGCTAYAEVGQIQVTYIPVDYTITYDLDGGSVSAGNPTSYNVETNTFTLNNPTRSGYAFTGWTGSNGSTPQKSVSIDQGSTGDKSYTANWTNAATVTTNPKIITGLTYNGSAQELVTAGVAENGTMYYRIYTKTSWSTSIPTATNAGSYYVQCYAKGNDGFADSNTASGYVTIYKADPIVTAPTAKANLTYTGSAQALVNAGSTTGGTLQYKVGSGSWGTSIPTGTNVGTYTVYYRVLGNTNYNAVNASSFQVTIQTDQQIVDAVIAQINAIGSPITLDSKDAIDAARAAYDALTAEQKALVDATTLQVLTDAEAAYAPLEAAYAANAVIDLINAIDDPVVYTDACHQEILDARAAYDNLTQAQKALVDATTLQVLTDAEAAYAALEADHNAANAVIDLINAIGSPITAASQTAIDAARNAYNNLTDDQKALVGNNATLTNAEAALAVVNQIAAIGEVTLSSGSTIADVRTAYDALTSDQQALVGNNATLTNAEAAYNTLVADHAAADAVIAQINAIGSPITAASQTAIDAARNAYDALSNDQKALVDATTLQVLTDAEAAYAALEADHNAANAVIDLINAIGSPITAASQSAIEAARNAYDNLTGDQQALVGNYATLTDAEAAYDALEADHNAANAVVDLINAIDDQVVYTDACHQEILAAREAYNNLTQAQKDLIDASTLQKLTDAEDAYASLNVDITAKLDPQNPSVYYSTFYDGSRQMQLPADVEAYTATVSGDKMLLKKVAVPGDILPAATAVVLRAPQDDITLTPSVASPVSVENNALLGTDVNMDVPSDHCYVLSGADGFVGFYPLSSPYTLTAHKAYIDLDNLPGGANNAPRRLRFVFEQEQVATGVENVQNEETKAQKVMIDGVMYIIRGEHMYDAQGQIVK